MGVKWKWRLYGDSELIVLWCVKLIETCSFIFIVKFQWCSCSVTLMSNLSLTSWESRVYLSQQKYWLYRLNKLALLWGKAQLCFPKGPMMNLIHTSSQPSSPKHSQAINLSGWVLVVVTTKFNVSSRKRFLVTWFGFGDENLVLSCIEFTHLLG